MKLKHLLIRGWYLKSYCSQTNFSLQGAYFLIYLLSTLILKISLIVYNFNEMYFFSNSIFLFYRWLSSKLDDSVISISHTVTNFEFLYEPFYITVDNAPIHDERFIGYGFTRNSQVNT